MSEIKVYRVPQYMSKRVNVICVDGVPVCTARGKKTTSDIIAKLSGYDVEIKDGRVNKLIDIYAAKENPVFVRGESMRVGITRISKGITSTNVWEGGKRKMSELKIEVPLRPCYVTAGDEEVKALFHRWCDTNTSPIYGRQTISVSAIVELEDGTIHTVYPENIRFLDDPFLNYIFPDNEKKAVYRVEGYNKDNDVYAAYWKGESLELAKAIATILDNIAMKDELVKYSGKLGLEKEPIDWVQVTNRNDEIVYLPRDHYCKEEKE